MNLIERLVDVADDNIVDNMGRALAAVALLILLLLGALFAIILVIACMFALFGWGGWLLFVPSVLLAGRWLYRKAFKEDAS